MSTIFIPRTRKTTVGTFLDIGSRFYSVSAAADFRTLHRRYRHAMAWKSGRVSMARQSLDSLYAAKEKTPPRKKLRNFLPRYFIKVARISTSLQVEVDSKKSTSLQVESK